MLLDLKYRAFALSAAMLATLVLSAGAASAQSGEPIKIGYGISQTGGLAANGKSALLAQKIWEEDINKKGGLTAARSSWSISTTRLIRRRCRASTPS